MSKFPKISIESVHVITFALILLLIFNIIFLNLLPISLYGYTVLHLKMLAGSGFIMTFIVSLSAFLYNSSSNEKEKGFFELIRKIIPSYLPLIVIGGFILAIILIINTAFNIDNTKDYIRELLIFFISIGIGLLWVAALITLGIIIFLGMMIGEDAENSI